MLKHGNAHFIFFFALTALLGTFVYPAFENENAARVVFASHRDNDGDGFQGRRYSRSLQRKINELDDDPVEDLSIPVLFGMSRGNITANFGDPRSGGRIHEGLDMLSPLGTPVVSPTEAVVIDTGRGDSAGRFVYTANPGDETFAYLHLDEIADDLSSGDELDVGDLIGFVGDTGNAYGGPAHLHFEIWEDRDAKDPFPRLTEEFSIEDKIEFLEEILDNVDDEDKLAEFLVSHFADEFFEAEREDIELPEEIEDALEEVDIQTLPLPAPPPPPAGDLTIGSQGSAVVALQTFLISESVGPSARTLAGAGATGYFGPITQAALVEYQASVGISPANGYYGPETKSYIENAQEESGGEDPDEIAPEVVTPPIPILPLVDLELGDVGDGVTWLQNFLIIKNIGSAATTLATVGATGYFGSLTQTALAEYQRSVGITPAVGYYGPVTRNYIATSE